MSNKRVNDKSVAFVSSWQKRSNKLQVRFNLMLVISLAIAFSINFLFIHWFQNRNHERIVEQNVQYVRDTGLQEAKQVELKLDDGKMMIHNIADRYANMMTLLPDTSVEDRLRILTDQNLFDRVGFAAPDGTDITLEGSTNIADREYFQRAIAGESGYEYLPLSRVTGRSSVVFYAPVIQNGAVEGVMLGFYELDRLDSIFAVELFESAPVNYLMLADGSVVSNSNGDRLAKNMLDELRTYDYDGDVDYFDIVMAIRNEARTSISFHFQDHGMHSVGVITQFQGSQWMILSILSGDTVQTRIEAANKLGTTLLLGVSGVFLTLVVLLLIYLYRNNEVVEAEMARTVESLNRSVEHEHKISFIVETLARTYSSVYFIDVRDGSYECIVEKQDTSLACIPQVGKWADTVELYREQFLKDGYEEFADLFQNPAAFDSLLGNRESVSVEYMRADGSWRKAFLFPAGRSDDGGLNHVLFAVQRIDEQKQKELETKKALEEAYRAAQLASSAKTSFLSNMSHDIRTPMNAIIGMTAIAAANLTNADKVSDCLKKITASCKHLLGLINEILDMSKIESGKVDLSEEEFSLSEVIDDLINMNQSLIREKNHTLTVRVNNLDHEKVLGDRTRLQQVFTNLLTNAIKYTPAGGKLKITVTELPKQKSSVGRYDVVFEDNGIGMSEEYLQNLFEPFTRAKDKRITTIQGTGLGMPIARNIVRMMNGDITVESKLNQGSKFTVSFALKLQSEKETDLSRFAELPVLVVDDDVAICESTCMILNSLGMHSEWVTSGEEAVDKVAARHRTGQDYYAIILDWKMPGMNGLETARVIRDRIGAKMPIVVISAYDWTDIEQEAKEVGVRAFLGKPLFRSRVIELFSEMTGEEKVEAEPAPQEDIDFTGKRVLLAEDNELNREIAVEMLSMTGMVLETAENGKLCLDMFNASRPGYYDLILMDIQMPVMDGYEAARQIRASSHPDGKKIPIVAMTANAFSSDVRAALNAGMNGHIAKPIDIAAVVRTIQELLEDR